MASRKNLLDWYDRHARILPWRISPQARKNGVRPDPYRVWLSEIMLQQTTVKTVRDYFEKFTRRWPSLQDLADASEDDVMRTWAGLGYYSRARNMKKSADEIAATHGGRFPDSREELQKLPGIGEYTSAAIAAIAFDRPEAVVDGNVERVVTRLLALDTPLPAAKPAIRAHVTDMLDRDRPGDFAQAMMDLGATICTPRRPACALCPINGDCAAFSDPDIDPQSLPVKAPKRAKPKRVGAAFVALNGDGAVLLERRKTGGLLGGMTQLPTTGWSSRKNGETGAEHAPFNAQWKNAGAIRHVFTHFELELTVWHTNTAHCPTGGQWWADRETLADEALPTLMKKAIACALPGTF